MPATAAGVFGGAIYSWTDTAQFKLLSPNTPSAIAAGHNGTVAAEFRGVGVWRYVPDAGWKQLTTYNASLLGVAGDGGVLAELPGSGVWRFRDGYGWQRLTPVDAAQLAVDHAGDVAAQFRGNGVWRYEDATGWKQLTAYNASKLAVGHDGDVAAVLPGSGVWRFRDDTGWKRLTAADASQLAMDEDGNVAVVIPGSGVWRYEDARGWQRLTGVDASQLGMSAAPSSGSVAAVLPGSGLWLYTDLGGWRRLTPNDTPLLGFAGAFDHAEPLDQQVQGGGFSLTSGSGQSNGFDLSSMQFAGSRTYGGSTFKFWNDKPNVSTWTTAQKDVIMAGVADFNRMTGNSNALLIDPKYGRLFNFVLTDETRLQSLLGKNGYWTGVNADQGDARLIGFLPWDAGNSAENAEHRETVGHEFAHNLDSSSEKHYFLNTAYPDLGLGYISLLAFAHWQWIGQSAWVPADGFQINDGQEIADRSAWLDLFGRPAGQLLPSQDGHWYYLASLPASDFGRDYGHYNPYEDWTTTFEVYERIALGKEGSGWRTKYAGLLNKLKIMDEFFALVMHSESGNLFSASELSGYADQAYTSQTGYHGVKAP